MEIQKIEEYEQLSDEELLELLHKGREGLEDYLIDKYKGCLLYTSVLHSRNFFF